jgi:hypothetical protein
LRKPLLFTPWFGVLREIRYFIAVARLFTSIPYKQEQREYLGRHMMGLFFKQIEMLPTT